MEDLCELIGEGLEVWNDHVVSQGLAQNQQVFLYCSRKRGDIMELYCIKLLREFSYLSTISSA